MTRLRQIALLAMLVAQPSIAQTLAQQPRQTLPVRAEVRLPNTQALFDRYVAEGRVAGITGVFGIGALPPVTVSAGRIGTEAAAPRADADSIWRIYSMTKPVTAMAAMLLIEDGKMALDDPVSRFLPEFAAMRVLTDPDSSLKARPAVRAITIRHLLTHTAGLGYQLNARGPLLREYERLGLVPFAANAALEKRVRPTRPTSLAAFARRAAQVPLIADPGTRWHYSMGLDVLAAAVERAAGMPFAAFVRTRLLDPLDMRSTDWQVPTGQGARFATNYLSLGGRLSPADAARTSPFLTPPSFPFGGAGLVSTARDYDRFLHMLQDGGTLDGRQVMKPETVRLALSDLLPAGVRFTGDMAGSGGGAGYGAGGYVLLADRQGGAGRGTYGWGGAANTAAWVDPVRGRRATIMTNIFPPDALPLNREVGAALAQDLAGMRR